MLKMVRHSLSPSTQIRRQFLDLTSPVREQVARAEVMDGLVVVNTLHTTCCLLVNEFQGALVDDLTRLMERLVADDDGYKHNDPRYSDCKRGNEAAHLRAGSLGQNIVVGLSTGDLCIDIQIMGA